MNTNHALPIRSLLFLAILTALAAGCGASPDGQNTADENSLTESAGDPDAAPPSGDTTPVPSNSLPTQYGAAPEPTYPVRPSHGTYVPTHAPGGPHAQ